MQTIHNRVVNRSKKTLKHFEKEKYRECIKAHQKLAKEKPASRSQFYSNMGLCYFMSADVSTALKCLYNALSANYLNSIAYLNLASIHFSQGKLQQTLEFLGCCISCLYLQRFKRTKSLEDCQMAILFAENNLEAHAGALLHHIAYRKYQKAAQQLSWITDNTSCKDKSLFVRLYQLREELSNSETQETQHSFLQKIGQILPAFMYSETMKNNTRLTHLFAESEEGLANDVSCYLEIVNARLAEDKTFHFYKMQHPYTIYLLKSPTVTKGKEKSRERENKLTGVNSATNISLQDKKTSQTNFSSHEIQSQQKKSEIVTSIVKSTNSIDDQCPSPKKLSSSILSGSSINSTQSPSLYQSTISSKRLVKLHLRHITFNQANSSDSIYYKLLISGENSKKEVFKYKSNPFPRNAIGESLIGEFSLPETPPFLKLKIYSLPLQLLVGEAGLELTMKGCVKLPFYRKGHKFGLAELQIETI